LIYIKEVKTSIYSFSSFPLSLLASNQKGQRKRQGFALDEHSSIGTHLPNFVGFARTASVSTKRGTKGQIEPADERASQRERESQSGAEAFNLASVTHSGALTHREERNVKRRAQKQGGS
jgi:hypothetical protein